MPPHSPKPGTSISYAYSQDAESGGTFIRRRSVSRSLISSRRVKLAITAFTLTCLYFYFSDPSTSTSVGNGGTGSDVEDDSSKAGGIGGIWDQEELVDPKGWGAGWSNPFKKPQPQPGVEHIPTPDSTAKQIQQSYITPLHPDLTLLPPPSSLFTEINPSKLRVPTYSPFPDTRLREIISPIPERVTHDTPGFTLAEDSFARTWSPPQGWNEGRKDVGRVQWDGFSQKGRGRTGWETSAERKVREERRDAVKRAFAFAWQGYKDHAWGHDEVKPVSATPSDPFNNWGASIIDTLDTLLIMGFSDEYNLCRPHINQLNFHWTGGRDFQNGYTSEAPPTDDEETPSETWSIPRDRNVALHIFETSIRYLGGLLGGYDLSGDKLLLERAEELAEILSRAFNTDSGLPGHRIDPGLEPPVYRLGQISIAEAGTMSLEFMRLSQITGARKWFDYVQRCQDYIEQRLIPRSSQSPLVPLYFMPDGTATLYGAYGFGAMADSYYEYLIKTYKLLGGNDIGQKWAKTYEGSIAKAKEILYRDIDYIPDTPLLAIGKYENNQLKPEIEHLTCFTGAMLGLGAKLIPDRMSAGDMQDAEKFTNSCYWLGAASGTGIQPEFVEFYDTTTDTPEIMWEMKTVDGLHLKHDEKPTRENTHQDREGVIRWNVDGEPVEMVDGARDASGDVYERRLKGRPVGTKRVNGRGINRPETIESVFYMYRLTGDKKWQEKGWKMFVSWVTAAKQKAGMSSIEDTTQDMDKIRFGDNMESFAFAETFKYHYLLQSEPDLISLDEYVLNSEAHTFLADPRAKSGYQKLWKGPPPSSDPSADLGVRGQGTDAQKWMRLDVLRRYRGAPGQVGGGRGMGGGGGDPNYRPKPPLWHN